MAAYDDDYGNYIVITDSKGFTTKYAHLESMNVSAGQTVRHGEIIGKTGSTGAVTGSHLHLECLSDGEYYNPLFYFENGNGSIYGTTDPIGGSGDTAALFAMAEAFLGYPYVWGGSDPSTSFDCSGSGTTRLEAASFLVRSASCRTSSGVLPWTSFQ